MKVLHVIFSANRVPYLTRTLATAHRNLDWSGVERHGLVFDDYPKGRDDSLFHSLARRYRFHELILHEENQGLSATWQELNELIMTRDYNYVLHQEDDVELLQPLRVMDLIEMHQNVQNRVSMIKLKRNYWYDRDGGESFYAVPENAQKVSGGRLLSRNLEGTRDDFNTMFALYPASIVKKFQKEDLGCNPNEGTVAWHLNENYDLRSAVLSNSDGTNMINHIGDYFQGKRLLPGEPSYEIFSVYDPDRKYCSKTGAAWRD